MEGRRLCPLLEDAEQVIGRLGHQISGMKPAVSTKPRYFLCLFILGSIMNCRLSNMHSFRCVQKAPWHWREEILFLCLMTFATAAATDSKT